ncbi:hypothetical protein GCM10010231_40140 [Streptomyces sindenensis]|nr:hypothetical protein GCM10010231_40140 [Streptomyces sindenensis]
MNPGLNVRAGQGRCEPRSALGYLPEHTAATIDEPMAARQTTYAICRARSLIRPSPGRVERVR